METKLTAVQWLLEQTMYIRSTKWPDIVEQALEMEKEQIVDAYNSGGDHYTDFGAPIWGIDYYNETYNKSKTPPGEHCEEA